MTVEMIETFLTILKYQNITLAAQKLYASQSTVSHRLQMLEEEVGVPLFIRRKGRRVAELTPGGEEFIPIAERWMSLFRDTGKIKDQSLRPTLIVGSADLINTCTFVPLYRNHLLSHPHIHLSLKTYHSRELYQLLESRSIDIGYVYSQRRYPDIISQPVCEESMYVLCHKDSRYRQNLDPEELPPEQEIYLKWSSSYEIWHDRYWPSGKNLITAGTGAQLALYLDVPDRWAIVPSSVCRALKNRQDLVCCRLNVSLPNLVCYEIVHRYPRPSIENLIRSFQEEVRAFIDREDGLLPV